MRVRPGTALRTGRVGEWRAPSAGNLFLCFDNSHSKLRPKKVQLNLDFMKEGDAVYSLAAEPVNSECTLKVVKTESETALVEPNSGAEGGDDGGGGDDDDDGI